MASVTPEIYYDATDDHWVLEVGGPGNPVARSTSRELLESFRDYLESRTPDDSLSLLVATSQACPTRPNHPGSWFFGDTR